MNRTLALSLAVAAACATLGAQQGGFTADSIKGLPLRTIGPDITTGRISDIDIDPKNPNVWYVASASGGLFKTEDRGNHFTAIFDDGGLYSLGAVKIDPKDSNVVWLGTGENNNQRSVGYGGGVFKSSDAGKTWKRMGLENSEHIQNILIDPRNTNVVYVTAIGPLWRAGGDRGLYKTTDGGATWKAVLTVDEDTGAQDAVMDPQRPDTIYVAMNQRRRQVGQLIGGGPGSGLYKTTDGGAHFAKLTKGLPAVEMGRIGLGINPKTPKILYAIIAAQRGEGGFFRSDDSGATWARVGKQAPAAGRGTGAPVDPLNDEDGEEEDAAPTEMSVMQGRGGAGDDWFRGGDPGYYHELFVDPVNPDTIYVTNTNLAKSEDGGRTWRNVLLPVHVDYHEVVWDPSDYRHVLVGNDGGVYETYDNWKSWRQFSNLPLSQFYRISIDNARPFYNVCGGAQDNGTVEGPSRTMHRAGIRTSDWFNIGGGDGFQCRIDPEDPNIVYAQSQEGSLQRLDLRTGVSVNIVPRPNNVYGMAQADIDAEVRTATSGRGGGDDETPAPPAAAPPAGQPAGAPPAGQPATAPPSGQPAGAPPAGGGQGRGAGGGRGAAALRLGRWHWDSPTIISPHAAKRLYFAGDRVYRSDDRGTSWTPVSGDLTRNLDRTKIPIMGKIWPSDSVAYMQATTRLSTITALDESPLLEGLLYAGTDDGLIQVTEDGGKSWRKVDPIRGVPEFTYVTDVQASARDVNTVFATLNDWNRGNFKPYVVRSADRGRTWTSISGDLPERSGAWAIVQDHVNGNLLFAGMEFGLYATVDGGTHWVRMAGVPTVQVRDVAIHKRDGDVIAGTFGRGVFVLDDYTGLRELSAESLGERARLYPLRDAYQYNELTQMEATWGNSSYTNPPYGALLTYSIGQAPAGDQKLALTISDSEGKQIRRIELCSAETTPGLHRVAWDLRPDVPNAPSRCAPQTGRGGFGGRGAGPAPIAQARYTATIGALSGDTYTPIGKPVSFVVTALPR